MNKKQTILQYDWRLSIHHAGWQRQNIRTKAGEMKTLRTVQDVMESCLRKSLRQKVSKELCVTIIFCTALNVCFGHESLYSTLIKLVLSARTDAQEFLFDAKWKCICNVQVTVKDEGVPSSASLPVWCPRYLRQQRKASNSCCHTRQGIVSTPPYSQGDVALSVHDSNKSAQYGVGSLPARFNSILPSDIHVHQVFLHFDYTK